MSKKGTNFWGWLLTQMGWTPIIPSSLAPKSVVCVAPHTSNRDFFIGYLYYKSLRRGFSPKFLIKKEWFFFPLNVIIKGLGGLAVNRKAGGSTIDQAIQLFDQRDHLHIGITPEGSRSFRERWKSGFYRIALRAGVPIDLAKIDYKKKEVGIIATFHPTGNMEEDILAIRKYYTKEMARFPENFSDLSSPQQ